MTPKPLGNEHRHQQESRGEKLLSLVPALRCSYLGLFPSGTDWPCLLHSHYPGHELPVVVQSLFVLFFHLKKDELRVLKPHSVSVWQGPGITS